MASNDATLLDDKGNSSDWVEIHNPTQAAVSVDGWSLTDNGEDLAGWRFPNATIAAGRYLLVYASGLNRTDLSGPLHTSFKLRAGGEYLALVQPDQTVAHDFFPAYPPQTTDLSYGLAAATDTIGFLASPTPGTANSPLRALVQFSHSSDTFVQSFELTLSVDTGDGPIRYTTDGELPTIESTLYDGPLEINETSQIRAVAVLSEDVLGPVSTASFVQLSDEVQDFSSNLPIVVLENFGERKFRSRPVKSAFMAIFEPDDAGRSRLTDEPQVTARTGVKLRGQSTVNQPKPNYALEVWDELDNDKSISILGMPPEADWVFYAPYKIERSLVRNPFVYELSKQMGQYATRSRFVEVFTNTEGGPLTEKDYHGVYSVVEKIERDPNRVDVSNLRPSMTAEPDITGGYIFKIDAANSGETGWTSKHGAGPFWHVFPDENEMPVEQTEYIRNYIDEFEDALYGPDFRDPEKGYRQFFDVDASIDYHILQLVIKNSDAFVKSTYLYKDRDGKIAFGPVWDHDRALGGTGREADPAGWSLAHGVWTFQWWERLFEDPDFQQRWFDRYYELRQDVLTSANFEKIIDRMVDELSEAASRNFERWPVISPREWSNQIDGLKNWLRRRISWMDTRFLEPPTIMPNGGLWQADQLITFSGSLADIYYTTDGTDPRLPGGEISPGAHRIGRDEIYVDARSVAKYLVPTGDAAEANWQDREFDDSAWDSGSAKIGYDSGTSDIGIRVESGFSVRELQSTVDVRTLGQADLILKSGEALIDTETAVSDVPVINYVDENGSSAHFDQDISFPNGGGDRTVLHATAALIVDADATYTFGINTDDGSRLRINGEDVVVDPGRVGSSDQFGTISLAAGSHTLDLLMYDRNGRTQLELFVAIGKYLSFNEDAFQLLGDNVSFAPLFQTDVQSQMKDVNSSLYVRIPFAATEIADIKRLVLSIHYDDGFVAYLNGVEVARRNAPETLDDQSAAPDWRADGDVVLQDDIDLSDFVSELRDGNNVLAIHGLNVTAGSSKFVLAAELRATLDGQPITLAGPATITARVKDDTAIQFGDKEGAPWSPAITFAFSEQTYAGSSNLRITELNYNPHDAGQGERDAPNDAFEFVELMNVGPDPIELGGVQFSEGLAFTFASQMLQPNDRIVIVDDVDSFRSRYGNTARIANGADEQGGNNGEYGGRMNNAGETIKLVDRLGHTIQQFSYDDIPPWPADADGAGSSLELIDPLAVSNSPFNWNASDQLGGTPGRDATLRGDFTDDDTIDGNDIDMLFQQIASGTNSSEFDLNQDSRVDFSDVDELVQNILHTQFGDANLDRRVDMEDFMQFAVNFGVADHAGWTSGDFDGDGVVSFRDFVLLTNQIDIG